MLLTSATTSGLRIVIPTLVSSACGTFTGFAITWTRRLKWPLVCGSVMYLAGTVCLALLRRDLPSAAYTLVLFPGAIGGGFQFPGSMMAVLASSEQAEQAVVTSTLILWRSLGTVLGVALSSLVVQNSLRHYLDELVSGPRKAQVIKEVRASVEAVAALEQPYRDQVVRSYEAALGLMFTCCIGFAVVSVALIIAARLKRLPRRK